MANWWFDAQGRNTLKGVDDDPTNRPVLPVDSIIEFLLGNPFARRDFQLILPAMLPAEQERLNAIVEQNPRCLRDDPDPDPQVLSDQFMGALNKPITFFDANRRTRRR